VEIHAPHRAVASLKEDLVHLVLITAGVLIALSFEGIAGWREHRALVHEARVNLASEIRDNMNELGHRLKNIPTERRNIDRAHQVLTTLTERRPVERSLELGIVTADLHDASHATAQLTGAFAQNLSRTLSLGDMLARSQKPSDREIEDLRRQLRLLSASLTVEEQIGGALLDDYKRVLQGAERR